MVAEKEGLDVDEKALQIAAKHSKGSVRNCLQHLQTMMNYVGDGKITVEETLEALGVIDDSLYFDLVDAILGTNMLKSFLTINRLFLDGKEARVIIDGIYEHLNNLLIARTCTEHLDQFDFTQEEIKKYAHQNNQTNGNVLLKLMNLVGRIAYDIEYSLNPAQSFNKFAVESIQAVKSIKLATARKK
jgi:DNA polymerase-3 subunit gamma/tau